MKVAVCAHVLVGFGQLTAPQNGVLAKTKGLAS
jgi:hypothetical protein